MPDVRPCVCPSVSPFFTFYKRLHNSFVYEHKFTKLTQKVYVNKGMSLLTFGLILKNKMAARAIFRFFFFIFHNPLTLAVLQSQFSTFQGKLTIIRGCLRKVFLEGACVCVSALAWRPKFTVSSLQQMLLQIDFSNSQDSFISFEDSL